MSNLSPASLLIDAGGDQLPVDDGVAIPAGTPALLVSGKDGSTARVVRTASDGTVRIDPTGTTAQPVTDNGGSLTIDATSLPLPTGAATDAGLVAIHTRLADGSQVVTDGGGSFSVDDGGGSLTVDGPLTDAQLRATPVPVSGTVTANAGTGPWPVTDNGGSLTVDAVSLPLPTGAATAALQTQPGVDIGDVTINNAAGAAAVNVQDGGNSITVDGPLTDTQLRAAAVPVSVASLPLPAGAATEATLATRAAAAQLPVALVGGRLDQNLGAWLGSTAPTVGQKTSAQSLPVVFASDAVPIAIYVDNPVGSEVDIATGTIVLGGSTANIIQAIRATVYTEQTTNAVRSIKSTSAADTNSAGTGARKVRVTYLDQTMAGPFTEIVNLNGTTAVALTNTNVCFIERMEVTEVGSGLANAGTLSLYANNLGTGTIIGSIGSGNIAGAGGDNQTFWAHHYVPDGKTVSLNTFIVGATSGGSGTNATFFLKAKNPLLVNAPELIVSDLLVTVASIVRALTNPIKLDGPARVTAYGVPAVNNATLSASFDLAEIDTV